MFRGKKAQFYLLTTIILLSSLFFLVGETSKAASVGFKDTNTAKNYKTEAINTLNQALLGELNATYELESYTAKFIQYNNERNRDTQIIFLYYQEDQIYLKSYYKRRAVINPGNTTLNYYESVWIAKKDVNITLVDNITHEFITSNHPKNFDAIIIEEDTT
ncbi:hypothetical protein GOV05_00900 [Candidatus Woesearchaeota archaeon]|nr:hypothetical protein [Candidatus Woesearchaeota archaeon]